MSWDAESVESNRRRVQARTQTLQTVLLVVNIKVAYIQPARADRGLAEKLDILQEMIERLMRTNDQQKHSGEAGHKVDDEAALLSSAKDILSRGTSLYSASVAGGSVRGRLAAQDRVIEWADTLALLRFKSDVSERSDSPSGHLYSVAGRPQASAITDETSLPESSNQFEARNNGSDSDDEVDLLVAHAALGVAFEEFDREDWMTSEALLKEVLSDLQKLSRRQRADFDLYELQYKLAICAFHTRDSTVAIETFLGLLNEMPATDAHWLHACDVGHRLSLLYVQMDSYENARVSCENAMRTRMRLLGAKNRACYESLALLAHINDLMGEEYRARKYSAMIPVADRVSLTPALLLADLAARPTATDRQSSPAMGEGNGAETTGPRGQQPQSDQDRVVGLAGHDVPVNNIGNSMADKPPHPTHSAPSSQEAAEGSPTAIRIRRKMLAPQCQAIDSPEIDVQPKITVDDITDSEELSRKGAGPDREDERTEVRDSAAQKTSRPGKDRVRGGTDDKSSADRTSATKRKAHKPAAATSRDPSTSKSSVIADIRSLFSGKPATASRLQTRASRTRRDLSGDREAVVRFTAPPPGMQFQQDMAFQSGEREYRAWRQSFRDQQARWTDVDDRRKVAEAVHALHAAAWFGDLELAEELLLQGVDVNSTMPWHLLYWSEDALWTPLHCAVGARRLPLMKLLLAKQARLHTATPELVYQSAGALFEYECLQARPCKDAKEFIEVVGILLAAGWKINDAVRPKYGWTFLHLAVAIPYPEEILKVAVVQYLLSRGAPDEMVMARAVHGAIPLHFAIYNAARDVVSALLGIEAQQQLDGKYRSGGFASTDALCYATYMAAGGDPTKRGDRETVRILLNHGADPYSKNELLSEHLSDFQRSKSGKNHIPLGKDLLCSVTPKQIALASDKPELIELFQNT
ncbi:hypothetical protein LTR86_011093 [Recurvomyces mirabilis]|nr:hypothetical protein LTR86_011093 [Recurvomyces mirabilis]